MKIFLAGSGWEKTCWANRDFFDFFRLESFAHISTYERSVINKYRSFLLDSGAFTYLNKKTGDVDWLKYIEQYADFIKKYNVDLFFELDIDSVIGLPAVERLRDILEARCNKKCIPVWHKSRGLDYWKMLTQKYDYVAIGGIVTKEIKPSEYDVFLSLLAIANSNNCKVHALGFTNLIGLKKYPFYSVDSTSWLSGNRFGSVYLFDGKNMQKQNKKTGQRVITNKTAIHNFNEWVKFQRYAEKNL